MGSVACLTQFAPDIDVLYLPTSGTINTIELQIDGAAKGETAPRASAIHAT